VIELRPVSTDEEIEAWLDVRNRAEPADPVTEASLRRGLERPDRLDLVAFEDGTPVGMGFVGRNFEDHDSPFGFGKVFVLDERRRQGIGTQLFAALSEHARSFGREGADTEVREDDEATLDYLRKRGFEVVFRAQQVVLAPASTSVTADAPPGVELVPLHDDLAPRTYDATLEIEQDLPVVQQIVTPPYEEWLRLAFNDELLRECSFAALAGDVVVGFACLYARPYGAEHGLTGVRRAWRGKGVARALKSAQIEAARAAGLAELRTLNEVANAPIRHLNESLGYRPLVAWLTLRGPLLPG
jgi:GNAT superfamily N-acetyltransferase